MLSLCVIALNEERFLGGCLASAARLVDEIVFGLDTRTTDNTLDIARQYGARIVPFDWQDDFAAARNTVLEVAHGDWILALDADERLLPYGEWFVRRVLVNAPELDDNLHGFSMLVRESDLEGNVLNLDPVAARLFRGTPDLRYVGRIHEEIRYLPDPPSTRIMAVPSLAGPPHIEHLGYDPIIKKQRSKDERDKRLLELRLVENPNDAVALFYLAQMARDAGRLDEAAELARRALDCGPEAIHPGRIPELETLAAS